MKSRTKSAVSNIKSGFFYNIIGLFMPFIIRTVMLKTMGENYLGISSLFSSILQVLSVAEMGFSSAIVFSLYKPIAEENVEKVCALMNLYRRAYHIIGIIVFCVGFLLIPFLPKLINGEYPRDINLYIIYLIYLCNTSLSYFLFAYKSALLSADQQQSVINKINIILSVIRFVYQVIVLIIFRNYYIYLIGNLIYSIFYNLWISYITKVKYPNYKTKGDIDDVTKFRIIQQIKGLFIGKISYISRNSFDSIFLSAFCGLKIVAIYSNYYYIFTTVLNIILLIGQSITAGIGNRMITDTLESNYQDYKKFNFFYSWIGSWFSVCLLCLYQPFMRLWVGDNLLASEYVMILFVIYFYITQLGQCRSVYAAAAGVWWEMRYAQIGEMIFNLILNFILGYFYGIEGILWATIITLFFFGIIGQSLVFFKVYFKTSSKEYFRSMFSWSMCTLFTSYLTFTLSNIFNNDLIINFIWSLFVSIFIPNIIFLFYSLCRNERRECLYSMIIYLKKFMCL